VSELLHWQIFANFLANLADEHSDAIISLIVLSLMNVVHFVADEMHVLHHYAIISDQSWFAPIASHKLKRMLL